MMKISASFPHGMDAFGQLTAYVFLSWTGWVFPRLFSDV